MSDSEASSTVLSHNTYVVSSSSEEDLIVQNLGANNATEGDQEVNQPVGNNDQNEDTHQILNQPASANEKNVIPPDPRRCIGLIICKECNGTKYLGHVVGYNDQRKWFRVEYGEEEFEDMDEESVLRLRAKQRDIFAAQAQASGSGSSETMKHADGSSRKRSRKEEGYIPLAMRETKRDAYYYY